MKINGYEINYSEEELTKKTTDKTIVVELFSKDFIGYKNLKEGDKKALQHLVNAAKIINDVSLEQDHHLNHAQKKALIEAAKTQSHAAKALQLFNSLNGVEGTNGIDKEPVEIFKGIKGFAGRNFYPTDLSAEEFHDIIFKMLQENKIEEIQKILSARTMVRRNGLELTGIDFTEYFQKEFSQIAEELTQAAKTATNHDFKKYLEAQAAALLKNDENLDMEADKIWAELQNTDLEFTLSRENYDDGITPTIFANEELRQKLERANIEINPKDMLGIRVGIINKKGTDLILKFKSHMCQLAKLMPMSDKYEQSLKDDLKQTMVDADLADLEGDYAQARGGMTVAQNLPNNDKLSVKTGGGRRNVYHRQVRQTHDDAKTKKILDELINKDLHKYYSDEADHLFVIGHENGHSLGPDSKYQTALGIYKHVIEELKADVISLAFMPEYAKTGAISEDELKSVYVTQLAGRWLLKSEPQMANPHRIAELIIFNYMYDKDVAFLDKDNKMSLNFNTINQTMNDLLKEVIEVQLSKSPLKAKEFIDKNTKWGNFSSRAAEFIKSLGVKPYKLIKRHF